MKRIEFAIAETFGLTFPLKDGIIKYNVKGKIVERKSLYVPGIGWCPIEDFMLRHFTDNPYKLSLFCSTEDSESFNTIVGHQHCLSLTSGFDPDQDGPACHPCERLDLYVYSNMCGRGSDIVIYYNAIRNENGCEHLPIIMGQRWNNPDKFEYFIIIDGKQICVSKEIKECIERNDFDNIRIMFDNYKPYLIFTPKNMEKDFEEYDRLQIKLNQYNASKLRFKEIKPFYFLEEDLWKNTDEHCHIRPNTVINKPAKNQRANKVSDTATSSEDICFSLSVEEEIDELVRFFRNKGYVHSSQISNYIKEHKLGDRYKHISGYLELSNGISAWEFEGGISPQYYAEICKRLNLGNNNSGAEVTGFESYKDRNY